MEGQPEIQGGIVTPDDLSGFDSFRHLLMHLLVRVEDSGEIHHFSKSDHTRPGHRFSYFNWSDRGTWCFKPRSGRNTRWYLYPNVNGLNGSLVDHETNAL